MHTEPQPAGLHAWRVRILDRGLLAAAAILAIPIFLLARMFFVEERMAGAVGVLLVLGLLTWLGFARRLHYRTRIRAVQAVLGLTILVLVANSGLSSGVGALFAVAAVTAALLGSLKSSLAMLGSLTAGVALIGLAMHVGYLPQPETRIAVDGEVAQWPHRLFVVSALSLVLAVATHYLLARLAESVRTSEALVGQLSEQVAGREAEARARREIEDQLWRSQQMESLGQLAGGVAHDINNTLTVIMAGASELAYLDATSGPEEVRKLAAEIERAAESASQLTRQLQSLGRRDVYTSERLDPVAEIREAALVAQRLFGPKMEVEVEIDEAAQDAAHDTGQWPAIEADRTQLQQVLLNLAINARDATAGDGVITLRASALEASDGMVGFDGHPLHGTLVCFEVRDRGVGMEADVVERIFEPFFTLKQAGQGTGLGLSMAFSFAERSRGRIEVESEPGRGTAMRLCVPAAGETVEATTSARTLPIATPEAGPRRILLAEDDPRVLALAARFLRDAGYDVVTAADGAEAARLAAAPPGQFDLLVTDAVMPHLSGQELAKHFSRLFPDAPILICSAHVGSQELRGLLEDRRYHFLRKPFGRVELVAAVHATVQAATLPSSEMPPAHG